MNQVRMHLSPGLFACSVIVYNVAVALNEMPYDKVAKSSEFSMKIRNKRGAFVAGLSAMKILLDNARYIYSRGRKNGLDNVFMKPGGYPQALDDFERINANYVKKKLEHGKIVEATGQVGNKMVTLKKGVGKTFTTVTVKAYHATFLNNYKYYEPVGDQVIKYFDVPVP